MAVFKLGDTVKCIRVSDNEYKKFVGRVGKITHIDDESNYPFKVWFKSIEKEQWFEDSELKLNSNKLLKLKKKLTQKSL